MEIWQQYIKILGKNLTEPCDSKRTRFRSMIRAVRCRVVPKKIVF